MHTCIRTHTHTHVTNAQDLMKYLRGLLLTEDDIQTAAPTNTCARLHAHICHIITHICHIITHISPTNTCARAACLVISCVHIVDCCCTRDTHEHKLGHSHSHARPHARTNTARAHALSAHKPATSRNRASSRGQRCLLTTSAAYGARSRPPPGDDAIIFVYFFDQVAAP